jgi:uncharacterized DUF497 family protein
MHFSEIQYSEAVAEKLWSKHGVDVLEVEEVIGREPYVLRGRDNMYYVLGRTDSGRYLFVVLRDLGGGQGRIVTARDMTPAQRRRYQERL